MSTALAIRDDQTEWDERQRAALAAIGIGDSVPQPQKDLYLAYCQRTGLDPFTKQIYLIERNSKKDGPKYTIQVAIDGFRLIARRAADRSHEAIAYQDTLWCGRDGVWRDVWFDGPPAAAKVTIRRGDSTFSAVALYNEYCDTWPDGKPRNLWADRPAGQLAKCAEALALRKAFPHDLSGIYTDDEMAQADRRVGGTTVVAVQEKPRRLAERAKAAKEKPAPTAAPEPAVPINERMGGAQLAAMQDLFTRAHLSGPAAAGYVNDLVGRQVDGPGELLIAEADQVISALQAELDGTPVEAEQDPFPEPAVTA